MTLKGRGRCRLCGRPPVTELDPRTGWCSTCSWQVERERDRRSLPCFGCDTGWAVQGFIFCGGCLQREKLERKRHELAVRRRGHDCWREAVAYESDGALGHGWECGVCGRFLQAG